MFVGPRRIATGSVHHAENRVRSHEIPRKDRGATFGGISRKTLRVDRIDSAIPARRSTVEFRLIDVDTFLVLGGRTCRRRTWRAIAGRYAVTGVFRRRIEGAIVGDVIKSAG